MTKRRTDNTMSKRRTDNTMSKRRTDNTMSKRGTDNTMSKRRTDNTISKGKQEKDKQYCKTQHRKLHQVLSKSNNLKVVGSKKIEEHNQESIIRRA
jgi:N-dimethylarginine dimethylaminohydrolase